MRAGLGFIREVHLQARVWGRAEGGRFKGSDSCLRTLSVGA